MTEEERAVRQRAAEAIASVDEMNERLARRQAERAERGEWERRLPDPPKPAPRAVAPPQPAAQPTMSPADSAAWNAWASGRIKTALDKFEGDICEAVLEHLQGRFLKSRQITNDSIAAVEARLTASEAAAAKRLKALERRLKAAEKRAEPAQPRLVRHV